MTAPTKYGPITSRARGPRLSAKSSPRSSPNEMASAASARRDVPAIRPAITISALPAAVANRIPQRTTARAMTSVVMSSTQVCASARQTIAVASTKKVR